MVVFEIFVYIVFLYLKSLECSRGRRSDKRRAAFSINPLQLGSTQLLNLTSARNVFRNKIQKNITWDWDFDLTEIKKEVVFSKSSDQRLIKGLSLRKMKQQDFEELSGKNISQKNNGKQNIW